MTWRRFRRHKLALASSGIVLFIVLMAICAEFVSTQSPYTMDYESILAPPNARYILGTDNYGRDVWARLWLGARISLIIGLVAVAVSLLVGVLLGALAGYYGRFVDNLIMRATDVMLCFPSLVLMLVMAAALGAGLSSTIIAIGLISWPSLARLVRGEFLSWRERDFVLAARCLGVPDSRLILRHIMPNVVPYIVVNATFGVAVAILSEASLSFLGLGVTVPTPSWGNMLSAAQSIRVLTQGPWYWLPPGIAISLTVLAINFIGDGLRDALDPRALIR